MGRTRLFTLGCQGARGGISAEVSASPSTDTTATPFRQATVSQEGGQTRPCSSDARKGGYRTSPGCVLPGVLQPSVSGSEGHRRVASCDRSVHSKSLFRHSNVLHGNCGTDSGMPPVGSVGYVSRPKGCLFPHSSPPLVPEISPISNRGRVVSVSRSSLRDFHSSVVIHQSGLGGEEDSTSLGHTTISVPRRLANPGLVCQRLSPAHRDCTSPVPGPGTCCEQGEISIGSHSTLLVPRVPIRSSELCMHSSASQVRQDCHFDHSYSVRSGHHCFEMAGATGFASVFRESSSSRKITHQRDTLCPSVPVGFQSQHKSSFCGAPASCKGQPSVVDVGEQYIPRFSNCALRTRSSHPDGCLRTRLGSAHGLADRFRHVVGRRGPTPYQLSGTPGSPARHSSLVTGAARSGSSSRTGQFDCNGLLETPRWRAVDFANQIGDVDFASVSPLSDSAGHQTYSGGTECLGRLIVEKGTGSARRMVAEPSRVPSCYSTVGNSHGRSVRDQAECPPSVFRFAISRPRSDGSRCPVSELAAHVGLCVPTTCSSSVGAAEDPSRHVPDNFNRPALARGSLVCVTTGTSNGPATTTADEPEPTVPGRPGSSRPFQLAATRVSLIRQSLRNRGFSERVADRASRPQRLSTLAIYESKWRRFVRWCGQRETDPCSASAVVVGDFILHLFDEGMAISTIEGYRMAIASTLRATCGAEVGRCDTLAALVRNLETERVRVRRPLPDWDLSLVLRRLCGAPFEPLEHCSLKFLSWKTVLLVALASGKRRSELHALLFASFMRAHDWSSVTLTVSSSFLTKTALTRQGARVLLSVEIPALNKSGGDVLLSRKSY